MPWYIAYQAISSQNIVSIRQVILFHKEGLQIPVSFQCGCFYKHIQHAKG